MTYCTREDLTPQQPFDCLRIYSHSPCLYTVEIEKNGQIWHPNPSPTATGFMSLEQVKAFFKGLSITRVLLIQQCAYGEMIGIPAEKTAPLTITLNWSNHASPSGQ